MTFLQRTTCYHNDDYAKLAVGWFSSGTGAAGLVGAGLWWELRGLGVRTGISISSVRLPIPWLIEQVLEVLLNLTSDLSVVADLMERS